LALPLVVHSSATPDLDPLSLHDALPIFVEAHCHAEIGCRPHVPTLEAEMTLAVLLVLGIAAWSVIAGRSVVAGVRDGHGLALALDRKSTRLNSSHVKISYAVFCLKKKTI